MRLFGDFLSWLAGYRQPTNAAAELAKNWEAPQFNPERQTFPSTDASSVLKKIFQSQSRKEGGELLQTPPGSTSLPLFATSSEACEIFAPFPIVRSPQRSLGLATFTQRFHHPN